MKISRQSKTLVVSGLSELNASNATAFRDETRASLQSDETTVDVDLSETTFMDSSGLGALIALQKTMSARSGCVRILNPTPAVQQILELTRLHRVFEIVRV